MPGGSAQLISLISEAKAAGSLGFVRAPLVRSFPSAGCGRPLVGVATLSVIQSECWSDVLPMMFMGISWCETHGPALNTDLKSNAR